MKTFIKLLLVSMLLAAAGNSWSTTMLGTPRIILPGQSLLLIVWAPLSHGHQNPEICQAVSVEPVFANMNGLPNSMSGVMFDTKIVPMSLVSVNPVDLTPGDVFKARLTNNGTGPSTYSAEVKVIPSVAHGVRNVRAATLTLDVDDVPLGAPSDFSGNLKQETPNPANTRQE